MITVNPSRDHIASGEHGDVIYECGSCSAGYGAVGRWGKPNLPPEEPCWYCGGEGFGISLMSMGASGSWWFGQTSGNERWSDVAASEAA
jgi:hypothetical protein